MRILIVCTCVAILIAAATVVIESQASPNSPGPISTAIAPPATQPKQLWTCGMHPWVIQDHPGICPICHMQLTPLKVDAGGGGIRIDPAIVQNMGVVTAPVIRGPLTVTIRAVGMLEVPEPASHDVTLKINGYVEKLYADTNGMAVAPGDVVFDLYSPDLLLAEQELIFAEQSLSALDASTSDAVRHDAQNLVDSAKEKLRLWDIAEQDIQAIASAKSAPHTVPFRSPAGGHIIDKMIVAGSAVQAGMKVMRIEDHSKLWLDAQVYEDQIATVKIGQTVNATIDGVPGRTFSGKVTFIYPHLDHMLRTETVRTELENKVDQLRPGMYASVEILTRPAEDSLLVRREAVIDTGTEQIVFIADPNTPGHFIPRKVRMGLFGDHDLVQILDGLAVGDEAVTSGQFLMDVESRTQEAIEKLRTPGATTMPSRGTELIRTAVPDSGGKP